MNSGIAAQHDVGAAAGHVGGHGDRALAPRLGHDRGLTLVVLGVQDLVRDALPLEHPGHQLGLLDAGRPDEHRLAGLVPPGDVLDQGLELHLHRLVDHVGLVGPDHRLVRGDGDHAELVGLVELVRLGLGGPGHAGELVVEPEVVLQRDRGERLVLVLDLHAFLRLDGLVHAFAVAAAVQHPAGELVHDQDLAVDDDVVLVLLIQFLGLERVVQEADQRRVDRLVQVLDAEPVLDLLDPGLHDADGPLLLVDLVIALAVLAAPQPGRDLGEFEVPPAVLVGGTADNQRRTRFVDENGVDFVHDREIVPPLDAFLQTPGHVVPEVVETELVVGAVGNVGLVLLAPLVRLHLRQDHAHLQAQEVVDPPHPFRVPLGQVIVDGDDVHALAGQRVQVGGQHAGEGLALTGLHLRDVAHVQGRPAHQLHIEVPLADGPLGRLPDGRERLGHQVIQRLAVGMALPQFVRHCPELGVAERGEVLFDRVDLPRNTLELAE